MKAANADILATFDASMTGLVGHAAAVGYLRRAIEADRLAHAFLFVGPDAVGKVTLARRLAAALLGSAPDTHPDFTFVERERDPKTGKPRAGIALEQVQALTGRLALGAFMRGWKVAIIDGVHRLNKESANALLKTLEEPHEKTVLVLTAAAAEQVLPTIRSRCQVVRCERVPTPEIAAALAARGLDAARADLYARLANGRPGAAVAFAQDPASLEGLFALREAVLGFVDASVADRFGAIERAVPPKIPFQDAVDRARGMLDVAAELLRDAMLLQAGFPDRITHADLRSRLAAMAARVDAPAALAELTVARRLIDDNVAPRAALERFVLAF